MPPTDPEPGDKLYPGAVAKGFPPVKSKPGVPPAKTLPSPFGAIILALGPVGKPETGVGVNC